MDVSLQLVKTTGILRSRHKFDEVHIDMNDIYTDEDEESEEVEDDVDSTIEDDYNN